LKNKKHDKGIAELFRRKLGNSGIVPDASVSAKLMRELRRKEFLRFNPGRFNIYYSGVILLAAVTAAVILSSRPGNSGLLSPVVSPVELNNTNLDTGIRNAAIEKEDTVNVIPGVQLKTKPSALTVTASVKEHSPDTISHTTDTVARADANAAISDKGLNLSKSTEKKELQGGFKAGKILFESSATAGCIPLKLHFYYKSSSFDSCRWSFGDGGYSSERDPEWIFDVEGEYKVVLNVYLPGGAKEIYSSVITAYPKPLARFEIASAKSSLPEDEIRFYNFSSNAAHFKWDFGDGNTSELFEPAHRYSKQGNYNVLLTVYSGFGCSDSLLVLNAFSGSECFISFPNAFIPDSQGPTGGYYSPKSDEAAQVFHPVSSGVSDYQLKIFSKPGMLIFESKDISIGWDGYYKGQLSVSGVYIWKVRGTFQNGEPFIKMGDVTLLRNE
jgi:PKD repeat protein